MNIFYTCDDNFVWLAGISMISICENNRDMGNIDFYLLGDNVSASNERILTELLQFYNRSFRLVNIPSLDIPDELTSSRWPKSAYTRLFSGLILPEDVESALYLDCDTIVTGSLKELEFIKLSHVVSGVKDCISSFYKKNIGLNGNSPYINAGVLLIDLKRLRGLNVKKLIADFFVKYKKTMFFADQDVLNGIFGGNIGCLHPRFNVMSILYNYSYEQLLLLRRPTNYYEESEIEVAKENPVIVHFTTNMTQIRPWYEGSTHPYSKEFDKYLRLSPWSNRVKIVPKKCSKEERIIKLISTLPFGLDLYVLGFLHSIVRPLIKRFF